MNEVSKSLGPMSATIWSTLPWRGVLVVLGASFLTASVLSTVLAKVFLPGGAASQPPAARAPSALAIPNPTSSLSQNGVDIILKRNLFNSEGAAEDEKKTDIAPQQSTVEIVKSDLPVKLLGTIYGGDPLTGLALVENSSKKTINSFMVGDTLLKEAVVKEVHREKIIIDRNGRLEYIEAAKAELNRSRRKKRVAPAASPGIAPIATEPPPSSFKEEGFERKERDSTMSRSYKDKLLSTDFTKVLQDAKATPNVDPATNELKGFSLTRIRKDSIYEKAGLQNDDVVTEINGIPLTDTAQAIRLLQSLRNESEIEIRVIRGGSPQTFTLTVR